MLTGCQKDRTTGQQTVWQPDRQTERQIEDKTTFQLSYQNKSCSECQEDVRKIERQAERQTDRRTDRQTDRIFSLVTKTKVVQNVNRMSKSQSDRWEDIQCARQTEWQRQNDSITVWQNSRAAKEPALVKFFLVPSFCLTFRHFLFTTWPSPVLAVSGPIIELVPSSKYNLLKLGSLSHIIIILDTLNQHQVKN